MYAICWNVDGFRVWTGKGYSDAPWLVKKYESRAEAGAVAARINGVVVEWKDKRRGRRDEDSGGEG